MPQEKKKQKKSIATNEPQIDWQMQMTRPLLPSFPYGCCVCVCAYRVCISVLKKALAIGLYKLQMSQQLGQEGNGKFGQTTVIQQANSQHWQLAAAAADVAVAVAVAIAAAIAAAVDVCATAFVDLTHY